MSGRVQRDRPGTGADRRTRRTERALHAAFATLVQTRPYDQIRVADILAAADVGRSTFYEHYRGKDDLLLASMAPILDALATAADPESPSDRLEAVLRHLWDRRRLARRLLAAGGAGHPAERVLLELVRRVEERLAPDATESRRTPSVPGRLAAFGLACAQLGLVRAWLSGEVRSDPGELARGLHRSSVGALAGWGEDDDGLTAGGRVR